MANVGVVCRAAHVNEALKAGLTGQHAVTFFDGTAKPRLHEMLGPSEVVICSGLGLPPNFIDGEAMDAAPSLRLIQQFGVGKEVMDVEAAHRRGVWVATLPQANSVAVAEIGTVLDLRPREAGHNDVAGALREKHRDAAVRRGVRQALLRPSV